MSDVRLIDANALMKNVGKMPQLRGITYGRMKKAVEETPTIDAVPVVHGRWEYDRPNHYKCSVCDAMWSGVVRFMKFCPNCGAKMDGGASDA